MMTSIISFLSGIASAIGSVFKFRSTPEMQRERAEDRQQEIEADRVARVDEMRQAVFSGDDERVNSIVNQILLCFLAVASILLVVGCVSTPARVVYIPTDRRIESCTNSIGIACKAVPDAVFAELLEAAIELKDLRREMAVDKRVSH